MNRPNQPASAAVSAEALFGSEAADYARYRPGLPDAAIHLLAATQHGVPGPVLLDMGTGTGQVPRALLPVLRRLVHIDLVDVNRHMLETALTALEPVRGSCSISTFAGEAHTFTPTAPGRAPTLITSCRSFHWMVRPEVLDMADRVAAVNAVVAIMGDGSLWTHAADWTVALRGRAVCGGRSAPRVASGTSRSTRTTAPTNAKWTPSAAGSPASALPHHGWWPPTPRCGPRPDAARRRPPARAAAPHLPPHRAARVGHPPQRPAPAGRRQPAAGEAGAPPRGRPAPPLTRRRKVRPGHRREGRRSGPLAYGAHAR